MQWSKTILWQAIQHSNEEFGAINQKLDKQCEIGAMWKLSGAKAKSAKWAFGAFPVAKQDNLICLVQDF